MRADALIPTVGAPADLLLRCLPLVAVVKVCLLKRPSRPPDSRSNRLDMDPALEKSRSPLIANVRTGQTERTNRVQPRASDVTRRVARSPNELRVSVDSEPCVYAARRSY